MSRSGSDDGGRHRAARLVGPLLLTAGAALAGDGQLQVVGDEPRAFGYQLGDVVTRRFVIEIPDGLKIDPSSLPQPGRRGRAFELRQVDAQQARAAGGSTLRLTLEYQVFVSPPQVRTLELPPVLLRFEGQPRAQELRIDAWPVTVAPLVPPEVSPRRGLGELQADSPTPLIDTRSTRVRLLACAAVLAVLAGYLSQVYFGAAWLARRQRPFERAWRVLRGQRGGTEQQRAAFLAIHEALNRSAGVVLFEQGIAAFVAAQPRFAALGADLAEFFRRSRLEFFGDGAGAAGERDALPWLTEFGRRCRDAERGAA